MSFMERKNKLIKNTLILSIGTLFTKVMTFFMVPLFSRWLTTNDYGTYDLYITYITLLIPVITLSVGEGIFRKILDKDENIIRSIITSAFLIIFFGILISLCILLIFFNKIQSFYPFILLFISETLFETIMFIIRGLKKLKIYAICSFVFTFLMSTLSTLLILVFNMGLSGLLLGYGISYLCVSIYIILKLQLIKYINIRLFSFDIIKELLDYSLPLIPNSIGWWIVNVCDRSIIVSVLGTSLNGVYAIANKVPAICTSLFSVFHLSWQQSASEEVDNKDFNQYINNVYQNSIKILISISCLIMASNFIFFQYIFDGKYSNGYFQTPILIMAILVSFLSQFIGGIFISFQNTKINGLTTIIGGVCNIIINLFFIRQYGLYAASISTLISYLVMFLIRFIILNKKVKIALDIKSIYYFIFLFYIFISQYINNYTLNFINLILTIIYFIFVNQLLIEKILKKIKLR